MDYQDRASKSVNELRWANAAIQQRLEVREDHYRDCGMSEMEIGDRLAADKWNYQKEWLGERYPGEDVSPHVFNGLSENGAKDRIAEMESSPRLRSAMKSDAIEQQNHVVDDENTDEMEQSM